MRVVFALVATLVAATLLADVRIHELYGFHINGFVWNLVTTPGGIASLEASTRHVADGHRRNRGDLRCGARAV